MGRCIFCGNRPLTKEDIFAEWTKPYLPRNRPNYNTLKVVEFPNRSDFVTRKRGGDIHGWRVRCVCAPCNNVWMSGLQVAAKPFAIPLITGQQTTLTEKAQVALSSWVGMAVICADAEAGPEHVVSANDRHFFWKTKALPPFHWRIWIGHHETGPHWERRHLEMVEQKSAPPRKPRSNILTTTYAIGQCYVHVICSEQYPQYVNSWAFRPAVAQKLRQIWPPVRPDIIWPPSKLNDPEAGYVAEAFYSALMAGPRRKHRQE